MMNFHDKKASKAFQEAVVRALAGVCEEHGMTVRAAGGTIKSDIVADLKFEFTVDDADAKAASEKAEFALYCDMFGLKPDDYGMTFVAQNQTFTLVKINLNRPKFCIGVRNAAGREMAFDARVVPLIVKQRKAA